MLVTCPECSAKISDAADPCPHCAFPEAGILSRERCEYIVAELKKSVGEKIHYLWRSERITICIDHNGNYDMVLQDVSVEPMTLGGHKETGYCVAVSLRCPKCWKEDKGCYNL